MKRIILLFLICLSSGCSITKGQAREGTLTINTQSLLVHNNDGMPCWTFELVGQWEFYKNKLLFSENFINQSFSSHYLSIPGSWNIAFPDGKGFGTYRLYIVLDRLYSTLGLKMSMIHSSYKIWINGSPIASEGNVSSISEGKIYSPKQNYFYFST